MKLKININNILGSIVKEDERYIVVDNTTLNNLTISSTKINPNQSTTGHKHKGQEEVYIFVEGSGKMWLDDEEFEINVGDIMLVEDGVFHKIESGDDGIYFMCVFNGGRE